jgi:hypothetical protein
MDPTIEIVNTTIGIPSTVSGDIPNMNDIQTPTSPSIDTIIEGIIATRVEKAIPVMTEFTDELDEVIRDIGREVAQSELEDFDFSDSIQNWFDYSFDADDMVTNALDNILPYGVDLSEVLTPGNFNASDFELVDDEAFGSFREEIETALTEISEKVSSGAGESQDDSGRLDAIENRLDAIERRLDEAAVTLDI